MNKEEIKQNIIEKLQIAHNASRDEKEFFRCVDLALDEFAEKLLKQNNDKIVEKIEQKFGKYESFTGYMGYQEGIIQGITGFQSEQDIQRDNIINLINSLSQENKEDEN